MGTSTGIRTNGAGANQGSEVGDQCNRSMGTPLGLASNGAKYNQVINGHFYWYQDEWSRRQPGLRGRRPVQPQHGHTTGLGVQRGEVQPGDQWALLLVSGGVEQRGPRVPPAAGTIGHPADREVQGHQG